MHHNHVLCHGKCRDMYYLIKFILQTFHMHTNSINMSPNCPPLHISARLYHSLNCKLMPCVCLRVSLRVLYIILLESQGSQTGTLQYWCFIEQSLKVINFKENNKIFSDGVEVTSGSQRV